MRSLPVAHRLVSLIWISQTIGVYACAPEPPEVTTVDACCVDSTKAAMARAYKATGPTTAVSDSVSTQFAAADVSAGRSLYLNHGCGVCHGSDGHGDGPLSATLSPKPRDFREQAAFVQGRSVKEIAVTLERGVIRKGSLMPAFSHISEMDRLKIATYIAALSATP